MSLQKPENYSNTFERDISVAAKHNR